jgi:hypothetical protein
VKDEQKKTLECQEGLFEGGIQRVGGKTGDVTVITSSQSAGGGGRDRTEPTLEGGKLGATSQEVEVPNS